jgi:hypothetical protein
MANPGTPISAANCKVRIGGPSNTSALVLYCQEWEIDPEVNYDDTTNFEGGGFGQQTGCINKAKVRFTLWWDRGANPYSNPLNIIPGTPMLNVSLFTNGVGSPGWLIPQLDIPRAPMVAKVDQVLKMTIEGMSNGAYSFPSGNT